MKRARGGKEWEDRGGSGGYHGYNNNMDFGHNNWNSMDNNSGGQMGHQRGNDGQHR